MFGALNPDLLAEHFLKDLELFPAQTCTCDRSRADGTVLFEQHKRSIRLRLHFCHVSLLGAESGQGGEPLRQSVVITHLGAIGLHLLPRAEL
jgi:hypothetical protein